jgi:preprotein translocase subunit SecA
LPQVFFGFYKKLAGMTGTAQAAAAEFFESYKLKVEPPLTIHNFSQSLKLDATQSSNMQRFRDPHPPC